MLACSDVSTIASAAIGRLLLSLFLVGTNDNDSDTKRVVASIQ